MDSRPSNQLPPFLRSFDDLSGHFEEHFESLDSVERGRQFLALAQRIIPLLDECESFPAPEPSEKESHDGGVDLLTATSDAGQVLRAQSKYKIASAHEFDGVISKFQDYASKQGRRGPQRELSFDVASPPSIVFCVVTSSKLEGILAKYRASQYASVAFFQSLEAAQRIIVVDGPRILTTLQNLYRKVHIIPTNIELRSPFGWLAVNGVRIGIVPGKDLVDLYRDNGDGLFFENIRDFLGVTSGKKKGGEERVTVNEEIINTIRRDPAKMLERNNGISFRAEVVEAIDEKTLRLGAAGIINGCQTTMCLVNAGQFDDACLVLVKVVRTSDAWDVAKASNHQNAVAQIDLDLARYLRPQQLGKLGTDLGYAVRTDTPAGILSTIYQNKIDYDEMRSLYLGLFSRKPRNVFEGNYTELRADVLAAVYGDREQESSVFETLFVILRESRKALEDCKKTYASEDYAALFKRFYHEDSPKYRTFLTILALCAMLRVDLEERSPDASAEGTRMLDFLTRARRELENSPNEYRMWYLGAFAVVADLTLDATQGTEAEVAQQMYSRISRAAFPGLLKKLWMRMDNMRRLSDLRT